MNGIKLACTTGILLIAAAAMCQDNPIPGFGASGGSNTRTYDFTAPYVFGDGSNIQVKWKKDVLATYSGRRNSRCGFVFDENGDMYWRSYYSDGSQANYGRVIKVRGTDGALMWAGAVRDDVDGNNLSVIVGTDAIYAASRKAGKSTVYALKKSDGTLLWESTPLALPIGMNMALYNGVIYGVTAFTDVTFEHYAFAINASTGAILHATPLEAENSMFTGNVCFVPNAFGAGQHGMYWMATGGAARFNMYGINVSNTTATLVWDSGPTWTATSHVIYNPAKNAIYSCGWGDFGTTMVSYDPLTGTKRWVASRSQPTGDPNIINDNFNAGFYPTVTLKPDNSGFILAGFGGELWSFTDPGDRAGAYLTMLDSDWHYTPPKWMGESQTNAGTIVDPNTGSWTFVSMTSAALNPSWDPTLDVKRHLYGQDAKTGARLWEWYVPGDVAPYNGAYNAASFSVGPTGAVYFFDRQEGANGTLYAVGGTSLASVSGTLVLEDYDATKKLTVPITIEIRKASDNTLLDTKTVNINSSDQYTLTTSATGSVNLFAKASHWLAKKAGPVDLASPGAVNFSLKNGDVDNDNSVTVFDYTALSDAFDTVPGDTAWNPEADLDGDDAVTVFDYNILSTNFDMNGDS